MTERPFLYVMVFIILLNTCGTTRELREHFWADDAETCEALDVEKNDASN